MLSVELTSVLRGVALLEGCRVPKKFPAEFKRDVVTVARRGDLSVAEVALDFGVAQETVRRLAFPVEPGAGESFTSR